MVQPESAPPEPATAGEPPAIAEQTTATAGEAAAIVAEAALAGEPAPVRRALPGAERGGGSASRGPSRDEPELVRAVQNGDGEAFTVLVERYLDPAFAVALSILRHEQDAEDGVQAAFLRALERIGQLRDGSPFGPWFYRVLRNSCLNLRRRETLRRHEPLPAGASSAADPAREMERRATRERVLQALDALPEMQRWAVLLYDLEGYDHREIAAVLEIAPGTSRAHLHHGRKNLRRLLDEGGTKEEEG